MCAGYTAVHSFKRPIHDLYIALMRTGSIPPRILMRLHAHLRSSHPVRLGHNIGVVRRKTRGSPGEDPQDQ
jgi:hypothetical protein